MTIAFTYIKTVSKQLKKGPKQDCMYLITGNHDAFIKYKKSPISDFLNTHSSLLKLIFNEAVGSIAFDL